jgi:hypothetical protein
METTSARKINVSRLLNQGPQENPVINRRHDTSEEGVLLDDSVLPVRSKITHNPLRFDAVRFGTEAYRDSWFLRNKLRGVVSEKSVR